MNYTINLNRLNIWFRHFGTWVHPKTLWGILICWRPYSALAKCDMALSHLGFFWFFGQHTQINAEKHAPYMCRIHWKTRHNSFSRNSGSPTTCGPSVPCGDLEKWTETQDAWERSSCLVCLMSCCIWSLHISLLLLQGTASIWCLPSSRAWSDRWRCHFYLYFFDFFII